MVLGCSVIESSNHIDQKKWPKKFSWELFIVKLVKDWTLTCNRVFLKSSIVHVLNTSSTKQHYACTWSLSVKPLCFLYSFPILQESVSTVQLQAINNHWKCTNQAVSLSELLINVRSATVTQPYICLLYEIFHFHVPMEPSERERRQMNRGRNDCRAVTFVGFVNCLLAPVISGSVAC